MGDAATSTDVLIAEVASHVGADAVRESTAVDFVDGVRPRLVVEPRTQEGLAAALGWAASRTLTIGIRGGGTKLQWGGPVSTIDLLVLTGSLNVLVKHRYGDLTATVEAGATLSSINAALADHDQWLPMDPPWSDRATIGGIVATNDSGPSRHRHGAPRDLIIGCNFVLSDGQVAKSGGIVVKNVAGYDLARLLTGSFGCLAVITSATFKLAPRAPSSRTVSIQLESISEMTPVLARLANSSLTPSAVELEWPPAMVHVRFESVETSVDQQSCEVMRLFEGLGTVQMTGTDDESHLWERYARHWDLPGTLIKISSLPTEVVELLVWLQETASEHDVEITVAGRVALGIMEVWLSGSHGAQARVVTKLRARFSEGEGSAVIRQGAASLRQQVNPWGPASNALPLMKRVKQQFDPSMLLNPGRGPWGI